MTTTYHTEVHGQLVLVQQACLIASILYNLDGYTMLAKRHVCLLCSPQCPCQSCMFFHAIDSMIVMCAGIYFATDSSQDWPRLTLSPFCRNGLTHECQSRIGQTRLQHAYMPTCHKVICISKSKRYIFMSEILTFLLNRTERIT